MLTRLLLTLLSPVLLAGIASVANAQTDHDWSYIDALFEETDSETAPAAAVAVMWQGEWVHQAVFGMADIENAGPADVGTGFNLASLTKHFTAHAIFSLEAAGQVDLDAPISTYLPELPDRGVTVRDLMVQTSGLASPSARRLGVFASGRREGLMDMYARLPLANAPGSFWAYNNNNYDLLSMIVERVSGRFLPEYLAETTFAPLGMTGTYFPHGPQYTRENRAFGYRREEGGYRNLDAIDVEQSLVGAGGLYASLEDMMTWSEAVLAGEGAMGGLRLMGQYRNGMPTSYGAGLNVFGEGQSAIFEHGGTSGATSTYVMYYPSARSAVIVLIASDIYHGRGGAERIAHTIREEMFERFRHERPSDDGPAGIVELDTDHANQLAGQWFGEVNGRVQVADMVIDHTRGVVLRFFDGFELDLQSVAHDSYVSSTVPGARMTVQDDQLFLWMRQKSLGQLTPATFYNETQVTLEHSGRFASETLGDVVWQIQVDGAEVLATSPSGRTYTLTRFTDGIYGNTQSNLALQLMEDGCSAAARCLTSDCTELPISLPPTKNGGACAPPFFRNQTCPGSAKRRTCLPAGARARSLRKKRIFPAPAGCHRTCSPLSAQRPERRQKTFR